MNKWMKQISVKDNHFEIYWSIYAVLLAFCIKKAKNNIKNHSERDETNREQYTGETQDMRYVQTQQDNATDKFTKGLGVSLAKTPSVLLLATRTDNHQERVLYDNFFFMLDVLWFDCVTVCCGDARSDYNYLQCLFNLFVCLPR